MKRKANIPLVTLGSLVISILLLFMLWNVAAPFFNEKHTDKSGELPVLFSNAVHTPTGKTMNRIINLQKEDLFLFFNKGTGPITLKYGGMPEDAYKDFSFTRPEICEGKSCVCYCSAGPYWQKTDKPPYLRPKSLQAGKPYSCPGIKCEATDTDIYFANSRGSDKYSKEVIAASKISTEKYDPVTMDIPIILHKINQDKIITPDTKIEDSFFKKYVGMSNGPNYNIHAQEKLLNTVLDYSWNNGYVLGGFGVAQSKREQKKRILSQPPVSLRIEAYKNGLRGICIHKKCLFEDDQKAQEQKIVDAKVIAQISSSFKQIESSMNDVSDCLQKKGTTDEGRFACTVNLGFYNFFDVDKTSEIKPILHFLNQLYKTTPSDQSIINNLPNNYVKNTQKSSSNKQTSSFPSIEYAINQDGLFSQNSFFPPVQFTCIFDDARNTPSSFDLVDAYGSAYYLVSDGRKCKLTIIETS